MRAYFRLLAAILLMCPLGAGAELPKDLPWDLREQFHLTTPRGNLAIAGDTGEWRVEAEGLGRVIPSAGAGARLADGRTIWANDLPAGTPRLERTSGAFGKGMRYVIEGLRQDGLEFRLSLAYYRQRAFYIFEASVANRSNEPLAIAAITAARLSLQGLGEAVRAGQRMLSPAGPYMVPAETPLLTAFEHPAHDLVLAFGSLPQGAGLPHQTIERTGGGWTLEAATVFDPPVTLAPGETLSADPLWIVLGLPSAEQTDLLFAWTHAQGDLPPHGEKAPACWVSTGPGGSADELYTAAKAWEGPGVHHALVPMGWESSPGSLTGRPGAYPRSMAGVAETLRQMGLTPGLTLDPLATGKGWIDPADAHQRDEAARRLHGEAARWDFGFYALHTNISAQALQAAGLSRVQAETRAFEIAHAAFPEAPLWPAVRRTLGTELTPWIEAAAATSRLDEYGVKAGPVAFVPGSARQLDNPTTAALMFYGGPIELRGRPSRGVHRQVLRAVSPVRLAARPLSFDAAPLRWELALYGQVPAPQTQTLIFPGAPSEPGAWQAAGPVFFSKLPSASLPQRGSGPAELRADAQADEARSAKPTQETVRETRVEQVVVSEAATREVRTPYEVKPGDTLYRIAKMHEVTVADLRGWNALDSDRIRAGQMLIIVRTEEVPAVIEERTVFVETAPADAAAESESEPESRGFFGRIFGKKKKD